MKYQGAVGSKISSIITYISYWYDLIFKYFISQIMHMIFLLIWIKINKYFYHNWIFIQSSQIIKGLMVPVFPSCDCWMFKAAPISDVN